MPKLSLRLLPALACVVGALIASRLAGASAASIPPDLTVAADGSGNFKTIQEAVASIPKTNRERIVVFVKDGIYHEKVRVDASYVTLRGQSRAGTRLEFSQAMNDYRGAQRDNLGQAVLNINGDDFVLENFTVQNTHGVLGVHAFAIYGRGDRTVLQDSDVLSQGNDTISLWRTANGMFSEDAANHASANGRYYHARLKVCGSVDFICPRGWCYMTDCDIIEVNPHTDAAMWHDGSRDPDMKFVMRNCRFDGPENFRLARHHHDAFFVFLDCTFSKTMRDFAPYRVIYPLNGGTPTPPTSRTTRTTTRLTSGANALTTLTATATAATTRGSRTTSPPCPARPRPRRSPPSGRSAENGIRKIKPARPCKKFP